MWYELLQGCYLVACLALAWIVIDRTHRNTLNYHVICIVLIVAVDLAQSTIPLSVPFFVALEFVQYAVVFAWCYMALRAKPKTPEPPQPPVQPVIFRLMSYKPGEEDRDVYGHCDSATPHQ
jgi:hypothetical protein